MQNSATTLAEAVGFEMIHPLKIDDLDKQSSLCTEESFWLDETDIPAPLPQASISNEMNRISVAEERQRFQWPRQWVFHKILLISTAIYLSISLPSSI